MHLSYLWFRDKNLMSHTFIILLKLVLCNRPQAWKVVSLNPGIWNTVSSLIFYPLEYWYIVYLNILKKITCALFQYVVCEDQAQYLSSPFPLRKEFHCLQHTSFRPVFLYKSWGPQMWLLLAEGAFKYLWLIFTHTLGRCN